MYAFVMEFNIDRIETELSETVEREEISFFHIYYFKFIHEGKDTHANVRDSQLEDIISQLVSMWNSRIENIWTKYVCFKSFCLWPLMIINLIYINGLWTNVLDLLVWKD